MQFCNSEEEENDGLQTRELGQKNGRVLNENQQLQQVVVTSEQGHQYKWDGRAWVPFQEAQSFQFQPHASSLR